MMGNTNNQANQGNQMNQGSDNNPDKRGRK
jgi:hypothetical protein